MRKKLLIVEDENDLLEIYQDWFDESHEITLCADGFDGLTKIISLQKFDILLLDLELPSINGADILAKIYKFLTKPEETKIIVCSGYIPNEVFEKYKNKPSIRFLRKPFLKANIEELLK